MTFIMEQVSKNITQTATLTASAFRWYSVLTRRRSKLTNENNRLLFKLLYTTVKL